MVSISFHANSTFSRLTILPSHLFHHSQRQCISFQSHPRRNTDRIRATNAEQPLTVKKRAAQPHGNEGHVVNQSMGLKIAIVGFGNFGQFLAKTFIQQGHTVIAHSRGNYHSVAQGLGATFFSDLHDLCEQQPDVIVISTSIMSAECVIKSLPVQRLRPSTLFVDVLSVKEMPKSIFLEVLPSHFDVLCTHPMFGPESGKHGWKDLPFMFDKVRIGSEESRVERFLDIFRMEGCKMEEMTCAEHDKQAAGTQFLTHLIGRILQTMMSTPINTKEYDALLLDVVKNTCGDSFDLFFGLFMCNPNSMEQLERFSLKLQAVRNSLFAEMHETLRKQLFGKLDKGAMLPENGPSLPLLPCDALESNSGKMEEMTFAEHDKQASETQFLTHFIGWILWNMELKSTPINTKGYEGLLALAKNTSGDSFDLLYRLFMDNPNSMEQLESFYLAFRAVRTKLFEESRARP